MTSADKTDDDTPNASLTVVPLADASESSKQWPDVHDTSSSFLEAALLVLCCHAPGNDQAAMPVFANTDDSGQQQCTFYRSFDAAGGLAAIQELDELSAECARAAIRARIGMSQSDRDAADAVLEEHRAALVDCTADAGAAAVASPSSRVADVVAEMAALGALAEDPLDEAAVLHTLTRLERRCITGIATSVHNALRTLLADAPKPDALVADLRDLLKACFSDSSVLHASFLSMVRQLEAKLGKCALGQDAVARMLSHLRAAAEELESARCQAHAVLKRAAGLTVFVLVAGKLKGTSQ